MADSAVAAELVRLITASDDELMGKSLRSVRKSLEQLNKRIKNAIKKRHRDARLNESVLESDQPEADPVAAAAASNARALLSVPDGDSPSGKRSKISHQGQAPNYRPPPTEDIPLPPPLDRQTIHEQKTHGCYVCKETFQSKERHSEFRNHCVECGDINTVKRAQVADLSGHIAVVTGARIKIGYVTALRLLRCGATVIATSRFAPRMLARFKAEVDSSQWLSRLHVYELDLCVHSEIEAFVHAVKNSFGYLTILINNAAQTIRRSKVYMDKLREQSDTDLGKLLPSIPNNASLLLAAAAASTKFATVQVEDVTDAECPNSTAPSASATNVREPVDNTQTVVQFHTEDDCVVRLNPESKLATPVKTGSYQPPIFIPSEDIVSEEDARVWFPNGQVDPDNDDEPADLRPVHTWIKTAEEVDSREVAEVMFTNVVAPWTLTNSFLPMLRKAPFAKRYVIQVSSMEGCFNRQKMSHHAHTNMGKAALNMFVRTTGYSWAKEYGVFLCAGDTGWVNDMSPRNGKHMEPPLDYEDGASRVLDPILSSENGTADPVYGVFLKDYKPTHW